MSTPSKVAIILHPSGAEIADGDGAWMSTGRLRGLVAFGLNLTAHAGTTPTLDVTIEVRDPVTKNVSIPVTFTQLTETDGYEKKTLAVLPEHEFRASWDIAGTSPSYTFEVSAYGYDEA